MSIKIFLRVLVFGAVAVFFAKPWIDDLRLRYNGVCGKAVMINKSTRVRYHKGDHEYQFSIDGVYYQGNSLETEDAKVRDTVCVVYLKSDPSVNRPIIYFNDVKCKCH